MDILKHYFLQFNKYIGFSRAPITKYCRLVAWTMEISFLIVLEARIPRSRCQHGCFIHLRLACRGTSFLQVLASFPPHVFCVPVLSSFKSISYIGLGSTHISFIWLNFKTYLQIQSHSEVLNFNIWIWGGGHNLAHNSRAGWHNNNRRIGNPTPFECSLSLMDVNCSLMENHNYTLINLANVVI